MDMKTIENLVWICGHIKYVDGLCLIANLNEIKIQGFDPYPGYDLWIDLRLFT